MFDWFSYLRLNGLAKDLTHDVPLDFVQFLESFCVHIKGSSILLVGTGSTDLMFTEWPRILKNYGASKITYIEIYEPYIQKFSGRDYPILKGDVREVDKVIITNDFDLVCWIHGPEHVKHEDMLPTFTKIQQLATKGLVSICPFGNYYDGPGMVSTADNKYEEHEQADMTLESFKHITDVIFFSLGTKDASDAVIIGYYFKGVLNA